MNHIAEILEEINRQVVERYSARYQAWLDKLTTLSLAALTALVSLQSTYVPRSHQAIWLLCAVWGLLALGVIGGLLALFGEARLHRLYTLRIRDTLLPKFRDLQASGAPVPDREEFLRMIRQVPYNKPKLYVWSAAIAATSVALAVVCLAIFAGLNLWP